MKTVSKINKYFAFIILFLMIFSTQKGIAQTNSVMCILSKMENE